MIVFLVFLAIDRDPVDGAASGAGADLGQEIADYAAELREDARYRAPDPAESATLSDAVDRLSQGAATDMRTTSDRLRSLGYQVRSGVDGPTGRSYVVMSNTAGVDRAWGLYVIDTSRPARLVVEVPHPAFDLRTEEIGLELFRRTPGAVLAVAGTHRRAARGAGDVAHRADSMFHQVTMALAKRGLPQVQLHGFDDGSLSDADMVLSPGVTRTTSALRQVSARLDESGIRVCEAWSAECGGLEGRRNQQGVAAAEQGSRFVHVEMNKTLRDDRQRWTGVVDLLGETDFDSD
ncbi:hypothetical protein [Actinokineospora sp.]|uniref:hypothetical protein n=1 Tax=Actinokineospora sp. TaxID=1872133 RepID=UPI003D6BB167